MKTFEDNNIASIPDSEGSKNRGNETRITPEDRKPIEMGLEFINDIVKEFIKTKIQPTIIFNGNSMVVPVFYGTPERWASVRKFAASRDLNEGRLQPPMIVLRRESINRNNTMTNPINKYLQTAIVSSWNSRNVYDRFAVINKVSQSKKFQNIIVPDYVDLIYEILLWTDLQTQMDSLIEQINVESDEYWGERNNYKFRVRIESFQNQSELPADEDRTVRVMFNMKVAAYLIPEKMLRNLKASSTTELNFSPKKVALRETIVNSIENI